MMFLCHMHIRLLHTQQRNIVKQMAFIIINTYNNSQNQTAYEVPPDPFSLSLNKNEKIVVWERDYTMASVMNNRQK